MMRTSMAFPIRFWAVVLACLFLYDLASNVVFADSCKFEKEIDLTLDLTDSDSLIILAAAGDLDISGVPGSNQAVIHARVCASKEQWLAESEVEIINGTQAQISVILPDTGSGWSLLANRYAWLDLHITLPQDIALDVKDSSGDIDIKNIAAIELRDSSGDIRIAHVSGAVSLQDSSGDIDVSHVGGDFTIESDSSGDIYGHDIKGSVLVKKDSSGDIRMQRIAQNVIIEKDSSGDISASDIGGDFRVLKDGSGGIYAKNVQGEVQKPEES